MTNRDIIADKAMEVDRLEKALVDLKEKRREQVKLACSVTDDQIGAHKDAIKALKRSISEMAEHPDQLDNELATGGEGGAG